MASRLLKSPPVLLVEVVHLTFMNITYTTFLGSIVAHSSRHTTKTASQLFLVAFTSSLKKLDQLLFTENTKFGSIRDILSPLIISNLLSMQSPLLPLKKPMLLQQSVLNPGLGFLVQLRWQYYITLQFISKNLVLQK